MDSTFSNVLEGARQYFQGLPAATGVTSGSPSTNNTQQQHPHQHHQQQPQQQPQQQQQQQLLQQNHHHVHHHPPQQQQHQQAQQPQQQQHRLPAQLHHQQQHQQRLQQQQHQRQNQLIQQQRIQQQQRLHQQQQLHQQQRLQPNRDNDGSVRSEQHSAVPYWDQQQNEGQGSHVPNTAIHQPAKQSSYYGPQYQTYFESKIHKQPSVQQQQQQQQQQIQQPQQQTRPSYPQHSYQHSYPAYSKYHSSTTSNNSNSFSSLIPSYTNYKPYTSSVAGGAGGGSGGGSGSSSSNNSQATKYYQQDYRQKHYQAETANQYYQQSTPISYPNAPQTYAQKPPTTAQSYHPPPKSVPATPQKLLAAKQKRESPLDLSVKTVKTTADSTHIDYDERKYRQHNPQYQPPPPRAPKIDFLPNFGGPQNYYGYSVAPTAAAPLPRMDFPTKRPQEFLPSQVPEKIPKMESWRQTIDQQIEQKLSTYEFQRKVPPAMMMPSQHQPSQAMPSQHPPSQPLIPQQPHPQQEVKKATKDVLNILRTSLQNKGARKLEQEQQLMRQIQQPTTEVMAPLQPKLGIVGRRNISPFTAASLERTSNTPPYKPSIPKAVDSVKDPSTDLDGLAAFLAARIRTKAELKQVEETVNNNASPPKLIHSKMRTDIRSSSETSVFDFQDSDNEMPVLERQSLVEMRKDRKTVPNQIQLPPSPTDELFNSTCDQFLEQLRSPSKKPAKPKVKPVKTKVKSDSDSDAPLSQLTTSSATTTTTTTPIIKKEHEQEKDEAVAKSTEVKTKFKFWDEEIKPNLLVTKPAKKPTFGDGSAFQPGWEEDLYRYKKSLRMPRMLIKVSRPPNMHRISTSLPDLDPYPISPTNCDFKKDSDLESNYSFANDSENSLRSSFIDKLLERYGGRKRKRLKADAPKIIQPPKNSSLARILKEKASIREVFGEDRPASAPPTTCVDELVAPEDDEQVREKENDSVWTKKQPSISVVVKSGTDKKRGKRKFSSGFDYIRKKKKPVKKEDVLKTETNEEIGKRPRGRRSLGAKTKIPTSVQEIQKEIKTWVLNKGVGETQLHRASRSGFTDIAAYCLEKISCDPSPKDNAGYTPLHEACSKGHLDIARLLLQYGALVSESAQGGIRPLHEAAENGFVEIVRLLLSYGADPTLATYSGITPLQLAVDDATVSLIQQHKNELQGKPMPAWRFNGPADLFDDPDVGFDPLAGAPEGDPIPMEEDIEMEISEQMLPNLYALPDCESERWVLLQDLSNILKIKSKETLLRQLNSNPSSSSTSSSNSSSTSGGAERGNSNSSSSSSGDIREMKMTEFLERARCCQFLNANEKLSTRSSKILLVRYTDKVKRLLNVEEEVITGR